MKKCFIKFLILLLFSCILFSCVKYSRPSSGKDLNSISNIIKQNYIHPISDQTLNENAIKGMINHLDNYSEYLNQQAYTHIKQLSEGKYAGIGIEAISTKTNKGNGLKIMSVMDNSPAQKAHLKVNDLIIRANEESLQKLQPSEMIYAVQGQPGSTVTLTILRQDKIFDVTLIREILKTHTVTGQLLTHEYHHHIYPIAYVKIVFFEENTANLIKQQIMNLDEQSQEIYHQKLSGVILDLRNNPGGLLKSAVEVSELFLDYQKSKYNHLVVYSKTRQNEIIYNIANNNKDIINNAPLVILINHGSASSAEIVASALHDHQRALLVGTKTFGKGSIQSLIPLGNNNGAIKITTGLYFTSSHQVIDKVGIMPDIYISKVDQQLATAKAQIPLYFFQK